MTIASPEVSTIARCCTCRAEMPDVIPIQLSDPRARRFDPYIVRCEACADEATAARRQRARKRLDEITPARYRWAKYDAPELAKRVIPPSAISKARGARAALSVVVCGPAGAGKTSVARAEWSERVIAAVPPVRRDERIDDFDGDPFRVHAVFATSFDLAKARREYRLGYGEAPLIEDAKRAPLLLLDELGAEAARGDDAVGEVIHARHANERATIYTTAFALDELADRYGDGVARRVFEGAVVIALGSKGDRR